MKAHAVKLNISDSVIWAGMLEGDVKKKAFSYAKAFILPSHQENFGQVVAEALSASTPVLISYKVNIWREIIEDGAGLACDDTVAGTTNMLREFFSMTDHEREEMKRAARPCYENRFSVTAAYKSLESILEGAINTSQKSS
jgi:glycosyltransferase involved in cell wall biosynthesis